MIHAEFVVSNGNYVGFSIKGHALFDEYGRDIVCAAVSSAVQLVSNGITEILGEPAQINVEENQIKCNLGKGCTNEQAFYFIKALELHLHLLSEDYSGTIDITISEV